MDNNNITDNNNIMDTNITNIKSIKKKHSFKKKKKARPILSQHGGAKYDFDNLIGVKTKGLMSCWLDSGIQMLWNIDCLRDYLLNTLAEDIKKLKEMTQEEKDKENKEEKKIIEKAVKKVVPNIDDTILELAINGITRNNIPTPIEELLPDNFKNDFKNKLNIILALQSIFQTYNNKIIDIRKNTVDGFNAIKKNLFMMPSNDGEKLQQISDSNLVAIMDEKLTHTNMDNEFVNSVDILREYMAVTEGEAINDANLMKARDTTVLIKLIFYLFESINYTSLLKIKKCYKFYLLSYNVDTKIYKLTFDNCIFIPNNATNVNLQDMIIKNYLTNDNIILLPETEILLFYIHRAEGNFDNSISANSSIKLSNHDFKLRGAIIHKAERREVSAHEAFIAYDDNGNKAALLNGTSKTNLIDIEGSNDHEDIVNYKPDTRGVLYLYELDEPSKAAKVDATELAEALGPAFAAVGADTSQPDTNVAAALTATLAATQVGPDAIEEANVPAALTATLAAIQPAKPPAQPPDQPPAAIPPAQLDAKLPTGRGTTGRGTTGRGTTGRGTTGRGTTGRGDILNRQQSGLEEQHRIIPAKPPVKGQVEEKPYSGSLEPSSDSNGENMVLGILLVITLAISGVLFVQH